MNNNTTTKRTDIHRPSAINPKGYTFVACDYFGPGLDSIGFLPDRERFRAHQQRTGGTYSGHTHGGTCGICGAHALYVARFHHAESNTYITTGLDCANKLEIGDPVYFRGFRERVRAGIEARAGKAKAQRFLASVGLEEAWAIWVSGSEGLPRPAFLIVDIIGKLIRYGSISEKQVEFLRKLLLDVKDAEVIAARRAAETAAAAPVPVTNERIEVVGEILSSKVVDSDFGSTLKILVKHASGFKVWGTAPLSLESTEKGTVIAFSARVQPSADDPKFGFFSRPTKARVVAQQAS
jgi:hypothetical protein